MIPVRAVAKRESERDYGCKRELLSVRLSVTFGVAVAAVCGNGNGKVRPEETACNKRDVLVLASV